MTRYGLPEVFLCSQRIAVVLLHRCKNAQVALYAAVVVIGYVVLNHLHKLLTACKTLTVISLSFQDTPKAFHRSVVNTLGDSGHTLLHLCFLQLAIEYSVCILKTSITMEQRMCIWIGINSGIQGVEHKRIIVAVSDNNSD